jgi:CRP/FNR family transcriptional regulator, anaerobic regulatory protein
MYAAAALPSTAPKIDITGLAMCRGLARQGASRVVAVSTLQKIVAGKALFCEGDESDGIYEVVTGMLRLYKLLPDGRRQITGFLSAGHVLGLAPEGTHVYSAEAITNITVCRYPRAGFDRLIDEVPGLARRLLTVTSHELRAAQDQMLLLGRKAAAEKVASFLLLMAERQNNDEVVSVPMARSDIADYLGLTTETVSRTFTKLKVEGLIALPTPNNVEILDRDQLEDFAAGQTTSEL